MELKNNREQRRLEMISDEVSYGSGVNGMMIAYSAVVFRRWFTGERALELGPAEGDLTASLAEAFEFVEVVDGSKRFCDVIREKFPNVCVTHSLFEEYEPNGHFDTIVLGHVLEHVEDPDALLQRVRNWLTPNGRILAATPNADSLHRQIGVELGLLKMRTELNESDYRIGHRRVFTAEALGFIFRDNGFSIEHVGGYFLKPFSNSQLESVCDDRTIEILMRMGEAYPTLAAETYVVARK